MLELLCKNSIKLCLHLFNKIFDFGGPSLFACGECFVVEVMLLLTYYSFYLNEISLFVKLKRATVGTVE